jgi:hypothetical protein
MYPNVTSESLNVFQVWVKYENGNPLDLWTLSYPIQQHGGGSSDPPLAHLQPGLPTQTALHVEDGLGAHGRCQHGHGGCHQAQLHQGVAGERPGSS